MRRQFKGKRLGAFDLAVSAYKAEQEAGNRAVTGTVYQEDLPSLVEKAETVKEFTKRR